MPDRFIRVRGAREHNLQNIDVDVPLDKLVVFTGLSGSGKSSLAFDTIYAEGQRKYVESLSVRARTFLEQINKPDVDRIEGLPPTLAIQQIGAPPSPRATVATTTEVYDFLRLMMARIGEPHCPNCGQRIFGRTVDQIVDAVLAYPEGARVMVLAPLALQTGEPRADLVRRVQREGFVRIRVDGQTREIGESAAAGDLESASRIEAVVDRVVIKPEARPRLADAIELSLRLGDGAVIASRMSESESAAWSDEIFSQRHICPRCGISLPELTPRMFSFNSPHGACPRCNGLGTTVEFDPELIVPDESLSLAGGAIAPWRSSKGVLIEQARPVVEKISNRLGVAARTKFSAIGPEARRVIFFGDAGGEDQDDGQRFEGVIPNLNRRYAAGDSTLRAKLARYQSPRVCCACDGGRLRPEALAVRINGLNIHEVTKLSISAAIDWLGRLPLAGEAEAIARPIIREVIQRLSFMREVGLGYLTLERGSATLSGGEAQRIRLATQLGNGLIGVCYVLDEPTIGLHQRDNERLLGAFQRLVRAGNSVLVVEHDEDVIRAAEHLIEIGPGAGLHGGRIVEQGPSGDVLARGGSLTAKYLNGQYRIQPPETRRPAAPDEAIEITGACENNLKDLTVRFPLRVLCAVAGVSGGGKSTLVLHTLLPALRRLIEKPGARPTIALAEESAEADESDSPLQRREPTAEFAPAVVAGRFRSITGAKHINKVIEVDQTPIGRTPRSNSATFTGVFDEIRKLYARTKEARIRGYSASRFSFNAKGGRCEACQGQGTRRIEMYFLPDAFVTCEVCQGKRYSRETLEVRYRGKSIADVLDMRVEEALRFFDSFAKIKSGIQALSDVGLGYICLGQPSNTLSGGEAQRVKLAAELAGPATGRTLYVLDEPTTGLHFADIDTLLAVLNRLVDMGNSVILIEHNLDVIKMADWVIELGPAGGDAGGYLVAQGTPEQIAGCEDSPTGQYLRRLS